MSPPPQNNQTKLSAPSRSWVAPSRTPVPALGHHPSSATEGRAVKFSYERLEFLGDSILGALVANAAFHQFRTGRGRPHARIGWPRVGRPVGGRGSFRRHRVRLIGTGTGRRGLHSALENVYGPWWRALFPTAASMRRGSSSIARSCPKISLDLAPRAGESQEPLQEAAGVRAASTPTYRLVGPKGRPAPSSPRCTPATRAAGVGRTKKRPRARRRNPRSRASPSSSASA